MGNRIFIQIASYRDPELLPTLRDCIDKADNPNDLVFGIAWQHSKEDEWDTLDEFKDDDRFRILDFDYTESQGVCWARNQVQQLYDGEEYTLQLDSHHRFVEGWDTTLINMIKQLQEKGHEKPLLTAYIPSYQPDNDPEGRETAPWWMTFDRFIPEGAIFFLPTAIPNWEELTEPVPSRFYSAHFCFTLGQFSVEVQHDPQMYFHGEEISIAVRAYTHGYDLFHPHRIVAWHEYTRKGRAKQWDDDSEWARRNEASHRRNRILFGMEEGCTPCMRKELGKYDFGTVRTLQDYEAYSGIRFKDRAIQEYTNSNNYAPNPVIEDPIEYENSFQRIFKHCIDIGYEEVPETDYEFWVVAFHDKDDNTIFRQDAQPEEIDRMFNDPDGYCKLWREFHVDETPAYWVVWPYSQSKGWCDRLTGNL
jgi:hypothetical protein